MLPTRTTKLIDAYIVHVRDEAYRSSRTVTEYRRELTAFLTFADKAPAQITPSDLARFLDRRPVPGGNTRGKRLAPWTRVRYAASVLAAFKWWTSEGLLRRNPLAKVRPPTARAGPPRALTVEQVGTLLAHVQRDPRAELLVWLAYGAGLRTGEIAGARLEDLQLGPRPSLTVTGKGTKRRRIPLGRIVAAVLERATARRPRVGPLAENHKWPERHLSPKTVSLLLSEAIHDAGIEASGHALRHTFATLLVEAGQGQNVRAVSKLLGHGSLEVTEVYISGYDGDSRAAVELLPDPRRATPTPFPAVPEVRISTSSEETTMPHELPASLPPDDLLDALARVNPTLAGDAAADTRRLVELGPTVTALFGRIAQHAHALDAALATVHGGPEHVPDGTGELAARLIGLDASWTLADQVTAAHPDLLH